MSEDTARYHNANPSALPAGTRLGEFELRGLLGVGGFGIVYLAFDHALEREVAVKEYMPASLAGRTETMFVSIRSQSDAETFALGLKSFVNEARLLARFDHPSLLKVHRFWEGNGTAYMAMPVLRGRTVKEVRLAMSQPPDEAWLRSVLDPLLGAIDRLHGEGVYHRDIAPDNIQIEPDGHPVLLDFGAARRVLSDKSQALTAILKPAYAPIEQYAEAGSVKQGPWTDIYALGATLHFLLLGRPPAPATARAIHDDVSALTTVAVPGCSENFLHVIDWMLAPRPADRPQSVAALRDALEGRAPTPVRRAATQPAVSDWDRTAIMPPSQAAATTLVVPPTGRPPVDMAQQTTLVVPPATPDAPQPVIAAMYPSEQTVRVARPAPADELSAAPVNLPASAAGNGSKRLFLGLGLGALVLAAAAVLAVKTKPAAAPEAAGLAAASAPSALPSPSSAALAAAASAPVAESAVAAVVLAPKAAAAPPATRLALAPEPALTQPAPAADVSPAPVKATPGKAAVRNVPGAATVAAAPVAVPAAPAPEPVKPKVEVASAAAPTPVPAVEAPKPAATNPEAVCSGKNPLLYFVCMEKECLRSEQMGHADCKKWRRNARQE